VLFDSDLARLYGVLTKRLNEQVRRNLTRFPSDFGFQLTEKELQLWRSQIASSRWGGRRYSPWVFTEHGAVMLASILNSDVAIEASIEIVRAFVRLREWIGGQLERESRYDGPFKTVFDAIRQLGNAPSPNQEGRIGVHTED